MGQSDADRDKIESYILKGDKKWKSKMKKYKSINLIIFFSGQKMKICFCNTSSYIRNVERGSFLD